MQQRFKGGILLVIHKIALIQRNATLNFGFN